MQPLGDGTGTAQPQPLVMACNHFVNQLPHWHCFPPKGSKFIRTSTPSAEAVADHVVVVAEPQHQLTAQVFAVEVAVSLENLSTSKVWRWRWRSAWDYSLWPTIMVTSRSVSLCLKGPGTWWLDQSPPHRCNADNTPGTPAKQHGRTPRRKSCHRCLQDQNCGVTSQHSAKHVSHKVRQYQSQCSKPEGKNQKAAELHCLVSQYILPWCLCTPDCRIPSVLLLLLLLPLPLNDFPTYISLRLHI